MSGAKVAGRLRVGVEMVRARARAGRGIAVGANARFGADVRCRAGEGARVIIGRDVEIAPHARITAAAGATVVIGDGVFIGPHSVVAAVGSITIGSQTMLAEYVLVRDHDHDPALPPRRGPLLQSDVVIGARVWIAAKASVGRGVTIGDDAVVGAHAYVSRSIEANCLALGVPARVARRHLKPRPPD